MGLFLWRDLVADFHRVTRNTFLITPSIVEGYPTFSSIPYEHRNRQFLTVWLSLNTERFDQIPERLVTTEMRVVFCEADLNRLKLFETLPYESFEALGISLYQQSPDAPYFNPERLRESFLLTISDYLAFKYVVIQRQFHEHLFTPRVISRLVKSSLKWAEHLHSGAFRHDGDCTERLRLLICDEDVLFPFGDPADVGNFAAMDKKYFHPEDVVHLKRMGKLHLLNHLIGTNQWSFDLEMPTSMDHCFWLLNQLNGDSNSAMIYHIWLRQFPMEDVLAMADNKPSWHRLVIPVFESSLLKPFFKQYPWLKGHVLEDLLGL